MRLRDCEERTKEWEVEDVGVGFIYPEDLAKTGKEEADKAETSILDMTRG